jgi:GR25 family glycosyltransferase involved in LPS biosynthesis
MNQFLTEKNEINVDELCEFYCLNYNNLERKVSMTERFEKLGISCNLYEGVSKEDPRILENCYLQAVSCMYGHLDMIQQFYNTNKPYGIFCEDDILIHKDFKQLLPRIIKDFDYLKLDVLLLGYLVTFKISEQNHIYGLKSTELTFDKEFPYKYHEFYSNSIWGTQMYMLSRENAKKILDRYSVGYLEKKMLDDSLTPFSADWTIVKDGNRAVIFPLITVEDGKSCYKDGGQHNFHHASHANHYIKDVHI